MQIVILADDEQKKALTVDGIAAGVEVIWIEDVSEFQNYFKADAFVDLQFKKEDRRINMLEQFLPKPVIINSVENVLDEIYPSFVRINAWNSFLNSKVIEGSASSETREKASELMALFNKKIEWLPDEPGFVTARVISMIINEAFISLEQGVSTKKEIDIAMKLGTNYPFGPFEWSEKIGLKQIADLLNKLAVDQPRYQPAALLLASV
jgi:3-hydroxybutyryl-CoA dehydrogenase